jgi:hypothetical protein
MKRSGFLLAATIHICLRSILSNVQHSMTCRLARERSELRTVNASIQYVDKEVKVTLLRYDAYNVLLW